MRQLFIIPAILLCANTAMAATACSSLKSMTPDEIKKVPYADTLSCLQKGWDPGIKIRPNGGTGKPASVSAGSINVLTVAPPEEPPGVATAIKNVSDSKADFALKFPPWKGFPCQLPSSLGGKNICSTDSDDDDETTTSGSGTVSATSCPVNDDTEGVYGLTVTINGTASNSLVCGGAISLSTYLMDMTPNPIGLAATEYGSYYLWSYTHSGNRFSQNPATAVALPTYLCKPNATTGVMERSVTLGPPISQMITYGESTNRIVLRLKEDTSSGKVLVIPVVGGIPQPPADCANEESYYGDGAKYMGAFSVQTSVEATCEGSQCAEMGLTTTATAATKCETSVIYPSGSVTLSTGTVDCSGKMQMVVLDRPNLVLPPGAIADTKWIQGRTAVIAMSTEGSKLYVTANTLMRFNTSNNKFTLEEGGTLQLSNGQKLVMSGPATLDMSTGSILLSNGGELRDAAANTLTTYTAGNMTSPGTPIPYEVLVNRSVTLPANLGIPTQPTPYIRAPAGL